MDLNNALKKLKKSSEISWLEQIVKMVMRFRRFNFEKSSTNFYLEMINIRRNIKESEFP